MSSVERSPSPLMFMKQHSDSVNDQSSLLNVPPVPAAMATSPSPQLKHRILTEGVKKFRKLGKRSSTTDNNDGHDSGNDNPFKNTFSKVMYQLTSVSTGSNKAPKNPELPAHTVLRRYSNNEDGYASDPGITHDASDDEPDSAPDPDIERRITTIERKLQKAKEQMQQDEELASRESQGGGDSSQESETYSERRSKPKISFRLKTGSKGSDQIRKKIEKYENQLELLRNGEPLEGGHKLRITQRVEDSIRSVGVTMSSVKNSIKDHGMYFLKIKSKQRTDGEEFDDILSASPSDSHIIMNGEEPSISLVRSGTNVDSSTEDVTIAIAKESIEKALQEKLQETEDRLTAALNAQAELIENQRNTIERLESQMTDVIDLQQQEVAELQQQVAQIHKHTIEKLQDFDDTIEEYQSKLKKLEVDMHLQGPFNPQLQAVSSRMLSSTLVTKLLSILLVIISFCLALKMHFSNGVNFISDQSGLKRKYLLLTILVVLCAIVAYLLY